MKRLFAIGALLAAWAAGVPAEAMSLGVRMAMWGVATARDHGGTTLSDALDAPGLEFTTGGDAEWAAQGETVYVGGSALRSGTVGDNQATWVQTSVEGAGEVSFWWKASSEHYRQYAVDYATFSVDGLERLRIGGEQNWTNTTVSVEGSGSHVLRWTYVKDDEVSGGEDCAWLDGVVWTPVGGVVDHTVTTPEPVPYSYFDTDYPTLLTEYGGDYETAAKATAANGLNKVWECYVVGISPTNETARFMAKIDMVDGVPQITWSPNLNTSGVVRVYTVVGKTNLTDAAWVCPTNAAHRFFKVKVEMP